MRKGNMTILASILAIVLVAIGVGAGSMAFFSDIETSTGNILTAGTIDLVLDMHDPVTGEDVEYNGKNMVVFKEFDLKPGDSGEVTISLHVYDNDGLIWYTFEYNDYENGRNEPELLVDFDDSGELSANMDILIWWDYGLIPGWDNTNDPGFDPEEGDNIWQPGEPILYEGLQSLMPQGTVGPFFIEGCKTVYMGIAWSIPWGAGNDIQSDGFISDVTFYVEQFKNNPATPIP